MTDDPNLSELLDDDKLPEEYPPDRPLGVEDPGVTADHGATGDSHRERVAREEADSTAPPSPDDDAIAHLVAPDEGTVPDLEEDVVATAVGDDDIGAEDPGDVTGGADTTRDVATERVDDRSAEELAVHDTADPPVREGDSYLDDEQSPS
ncbi:MAG: hypothetical protein WD232_09695 [Acidimicrobiales bacterium]